MAAIEQVHELKMKQRRARLDLVRAALHTAYEEAGMLPDDDSMLEYQIGRALSATVRTIAGIEQAEEV